MRKSFILYIDSYEVLQHLSDEQLGKLTRLLFKYQIDGSTPEVNDPLFFPFGFIRATMDRDNEKWEQRADRARTNGTKGGRPKENQDGYQETQETQSVISEPKEPVSVSVSGSVNASVSESVSKSVRLDKSDSIESIPTFNFETLEMSYIFKKPHEVDKLTIFKDPEVNNALNDYLKHRITIKKPATKNAIILLSARIRKECGTDKNKAIELLQEPVMNNWIGVVWDRKSGSTSSKPQQVSFNRSSTDHYK